ncbi:MAG: type I secretion C-terminal target domain-containing protein [Betaproteobacteria bacterium]
MATESAKSGEAVSAPAASEVLKLHDVLSGIPLDGADSAGAYITFQTIGGSTVISVDADGPGPGQPVPVLTLANVTGKTLQDLLNDAPLQC